MEQNFGYQQDIEALRKTCEKMNAINKELTFELENINQ
jgi:hypothetical protein